MGRGTYDANWEQAQSILHERKDIFSSFRLRTVTLGENLLDSVDAYLPTMQGAVGRRLRHDLPIFNEVLNEVLEQIGSILQLKNYRSLLQTRRATVPPVELMSRPYVRACGDDRDKAKQGIINFATFIDSTVRENLGSSNVFLGGLGSLPKEVWMRHERFITPYCRMS